MTPVTRGDPMDGPTVAVVVKGWPRLSETFIAQEILGLQDRGLDQHIVSLRHPTDPTTHAVHRSVRAPVLYLPEYLHQEPRRVVWAVAWCRRHCPGWSEAVRQWRKDVVREPTRNRIRRFGQACVMAAELPGRVRWLHSHFLHTPASVTRYAAMLSARSWSFSAHAKDIWTTPDWDLTDKLAAAAWGVTCTQTGLARLRALAPAPDKVDLLYHGLDLGRFPAGAPDRSEPQTGTDPRAPVRILTVGRAVEKKGFDILLDSLALLPSDLQWRLRHIGGGAGLKALQRQAAGLGLADRIDWAGPQAHDAVLAAYRSADLFVLACRRARDGDMDGLPNVLVEAQAMGVPCLATRISAIPELITDGETGVLVAPETPAALAHALAGLIGDPDRRTRLGRAGQARVRLAFDAAPNLDRLMTLFRTVLQEPGRLVA